MTTLARITTLTALALALTLAILISVSRANATDGELCDSCDEHSKPAASSLRMSAGASCRSVQSCHLVVSLAVRAIATLESPAETLRVEARAEVIAGKRKSVGRHPVICEAGREVVGRPLASRHKIGSEHCCIGRNGGTADEGVRPKQAMKSR
jgi:hypothetical protein